MEKDRKTKWYFYSGLALYLATVVGLLLWYSCNTGLNCEGFNIDTTGTRKDALTLIQVLTALAIAVIGWYFGSRLQKQSEKLDKQSEAIIQQSISIKTQTKIAEQRLSVDFTPIITIGAVRIELEVNRIVELTEGGNHLIIPYFINNITRNQARYFLKVTPFALPPEGFFGPLSFNAAKESKAIPGDPIRIVEQKSLDGNYPRPIQPGFRVRGYFRVVLQDLAYYFKAYKGLNPEEPIEILKNYFQEKALGKGVVQPDPVWFKFELRAFNPLIEDEDSTTYGTEALYYMKGSIDKGILGIDMVPGE